MLLSIAVITFAITVSAVSPDVSSTLGNILANTDRSNRYTYPTDLTRGIIPVRIKRDVLYLRNCQADGPPRKDFIRTTTTGEIYPSIPV